MKDIGRAILVLTLFSTVGCSKPTIDASSDETLKSSSQKIRNSLQDSKQAEFDEALKVVAFSHVEMSDLVAHGALAAVEVEGKMRSALDGKTADEVIADAARIKEDRKAREREQALAEIKELEEKKQAAEYARQELKKFEVLRSRFYMRNDEFMGKQPIIELSVRNGTTSPVSCAYFEGTIASPNRSVPWHRDTFNYSISGGLEPGEEATWNLAPNMFSGWGSIEAPTDAIFTVTVEKLDGPDGKTLYSVSDFDEEELARLAELKGKYGLE